ncbi:DMSO/TMAO reductase YedYZ molybdopterin-dependent catalytic subunit [Roseimicrobium gellanilyticum]|uniref:DMSO/TMAO reductase YedYZ molybdopterin-dependent catalytic subunit n=1 Tax=Roseimicrobium gellanilyticum TaxID=748857 RepID=A0A366HLL3_9BACT|nr:molybdopterin-dependent oxidoreductase [Roseimicrobium gellanilyticum]RBP43829.1 DMSO/TMAO reductase YedYZ molybdopterin-dependent catalytic subunit [Roseimicrobium gellanilyticum]
MKRTSLSGRLSRREFVRASGLAVSVMAGTGATIKAQVAGVPPAPGSQPAATAAAHRHPLLTPAAQFEDVSRGNPKPHTLTGDALVQARLTADTWRMEIVVDPYTSELVKEPASLGKQYTLEAGNALDLPTLMELGKKHSVRFLKAMQCLNIASPLGQGLWEGVPLREVLRLCGSMKNVRRIYYWGFHNNNPKQIFQSSLSYTQAMETPPGELPAFLAYRLNGEPIPLERGGPVRMVIPWAHGFKSIKWLQRIVVTNDFKANDTYANQNNDPESHLKTAAYIDEAPTTFEGGLPVHFGGLAIVGLSGLKRVEHWLHRVEAGSKPVVQDDEVYRAAQWTECALEAPPADWSSVLPAGTSSRSVLGFDPITGQPTTWPMRYSMVNWSATLRDLKPGTYEFRARAVDLNGFAQPEPRPIPKTGKNAVQMHRFEVT